MTGKELANQESQQKVWDAIAPKWNDFRQRPIPEIGIQLKRLAETWKPGRILDIGCGNCRNLIPFEYNGFESYGIDFSEEMLKCAMDYGKKHRLKIKIKQAYATDLPFQAQSFDYVLSVSMLHHLNKDERVKAVKEIYRVLKFRGKAAISVWNKLQSRFFFKKRDVFVPWHRGKEIYQRYYHPFTSWELAALLKKAGFKTLEKNIFGRMLFFVVEK